MRATSQARAIIAREAVKRAALHLPRHSICRDLGVAGVLTLQPDRLIERPHSGSAHSLRLYAGAFLPFVHRGEISSLVTVRTRSGDG